MILAVLGVALVVVGVGVWWVWLARVGLVGAQMFQIEEYEVPRLLTWCWRRSWLVPRAVVVGAAVAVVFGVVGVAVPRGWGVVVGGLGLLVASGLVHYQWRRPPVKKELVMTPRMRRVLGASAGLGVVVAIGLGVVLVFAPFVVALGVVLVALLVSPLLAVLGLIGGNTLMIPVEAWVRRSFLVQARLRYQEVRPRCVGIAGSYGKTSTKQIAAQLLAPQVATLATPKSFNTLMGVTRTINEYLQPEHRLFLVEMDAYEVGEIESMCRLVSPEVGVITSVGPQHLERFGTMARIEDALFELVGALPPGGMVLVYCGDVASAQMAKRAAAAGYRVVRYALAGETEQPLDVVAEGLQADGALTRFTWRWAAEGLAFEVAIPLLGKHNVLNTSVALALVHVLGFSAAQAVVAARALEFVPHRLQPIQGAGGITVIDDSYNANPVGVHNGLEVLAQMPGRKKILVTPGLVELGSVQDEENRRYGEHAAQVCDQVILVGPGQTAPIAQGLRAGGFTTERLHVVRSLDEVTLLIGQIARPGDVVLFANDLPDTYGEG